MAAFATLTKYVQIMPQTDTFYCKQMGAKCYNYITNINNSSLHYEEK